MQELTVSIAALLPSPFTTCFYSYKHIKLKHHNMKAARSLKLKHTQLMTEYNKSFLINKSERLAEQYYLVKMQKGFFIHKYHLQTLYYCG